jgi:hypothetical protein
MVERVKRWLEEGIQVKVMTARVSRDNPDRDAAREAIEMWLDEQFGEGHGIGVTHEKDMHMWELWDDRAVQVEPNTGEPVQAALEHANVRAEKAEAENERLRGELEAERNNNKIMLDDHRRAVQRRHDMIEAVREILEGD